MFKNFINKIARPNRRVRVRTQRRSGDQRKGSASVEAAICIPIIITLMLGTLEVCSGLYLSESLTISAFEGARAGVRRRATRQNVIDRVEEVLMQRNIQLEKNDDGEEVGVTITPLDFDTLEVLDPIIVTIEAPTSGNSLYIFDSLFNRKIRASVSMVREFDD